MIDTVNFSRIDKSNIEDHYYLDEGDDCYYLFEYTSGKGYNFSKTNSLISNLKKKPTRKNYHDYKYKIEAIKECSMYFANQLNEEWLKKITLIPVPPSKIKGDQDYDDRMFRICKNIPVNFKVDVKELIMQTKSIVSAHESKSARPTIKDLMSIYQLDESIATDNLSYIGIVDDVLTTGAHYRAMKNILNAKFSNIPVVGIFIARRRFHDPDELDIF